ncbi:hypothetical protein J5N97_002530 [Dioscorea zingiberensis]|uniref:Uncharacterized protein n=1 Tax=Dioscorea zingiberensis TaxID=325984 RepID=A0A9D5D431_9LILI|nr:hypothetical protein J5N97_002530 [Dioscorea zingiberensis]
MASQKELKTSLRISIMARVLSQTLTLARDGPTTRLPAFRLLNRRGSRSSRRVKPVLVELDIGTAGKEKSASDVEAIMRQKLEDAMQQVIVLRATPDWLPFRPGSSFWVPPRPCNSKNPLGLMELAGMVPNSLTHEENLSLSTVRGWPSSTYFIDGGSPHLVNNNSQSDNEEDD